MIGTECIQQATCQHWCARNITIVTSVNQPNTHILSRPIFLPTPTPCPQRHSACIYYICKYKRNLYLHSLSFTSLAVLLFFVLLCYRTHVYSTSISHYSVMSPLLLHEYSPVFYPITTNSYHSSQKLFM